ncbi:MAG: HesA/MoeB/ThiF family protein [Firmicutes bacterium]|nr:HesA/MoeB/ThiF family protein [Bacillota bacterium]
MADFAKRYDRNGIFSAGEQEQLSDKKIAVIGCGGLGGYVIEMLARAGVGHIVCCDGDFFSESNLNRQLLSTEKNMGQGKAEETVLRIKKINSQIKAEAFQLFLTEENSDHILEGCDAVVDGLDTVKSKLMLQRICRKMNIPMIHGAIGGWFGQVTTIFPGNDTLSLIYKDGNEVSSHEGNPSFTPAAVAALQVSETLKVLLGYEEVLMRKMIFIDMLNNEIEKVEL